MKLQLKIGKLCIQDYRMPRYLGKVKTTTPSYLRVFYGERFILDIPMPKTGRIPQDKYNDK